VVNAGPADLLSDSTRNVTSRQKTFRGALISKGNPTRRSQKSVVETGFALSMNSAKGGDGVRFYGAGSF